jgi:hypothetical protein
VLVVEGVAEVTVLLYKKEVKDHQHLRKQRQRTRLSRIWKFYFVGGDG